MSALSSTRCSYTSLGCDFDDFYFGHSDVGRHLKSSVLLLSLCWYCGIDPSVRHKRGRIRTRTERCHWLSLSKLGCVGYDQNQILGRLKPTVIGGNGNRLSKSNLIGQVDLLFE